MKVRRVLIYLGNSLTVLGSLALVLSVTGLIPAEPFALGLSSGVRVIAMVSISGCLMSAIGYGVGDFFEY